MEAELITAEATPEIPSSNISETNPAMQSGGVTDSGKNLGWVPIMMLGLASASLIYSIFYYRRRLDALKNGDGNVIYQVQSDMQEMKEKINSLTGKKVRNAKLV